MMGAGRFSIQLREPRWEQLHGQWQPHCHPPLPCAHLCGFLPLPSPAELLRQGTCPHGITFHSCKMGIIRPFLTNALRTTSMNLRTGVEIIAIAVSLAPTCFVTVSRAMIASGIATSELLRIKQLQSCLYLIDIC